MSKKRKNLYLNLTNKYSDLFVGHNGLCFGEGWLPALDQSCERIKNYIDFNDIKGFKFTYIKEKYGLMDIGYIGGDDFIDDIITALEESTETICEVCGDIGSINEPPQWLKVRCHEHI